MRRKAANTLLDLLALGGLVLLTASGLLLEYRLPPGSGGVEGAGTGPGSLARPVTLLWGLTRHQWGQVHFYLAVLLFAVLVGHLYLHGKWFQNLFRRKAGEADRLRAGLGAVGAAALLLMAVLPVAGPKEVVPRGELLEPSAAVEAEAVSGRTTLGEAAAMAGVAPEDLAAALGLPEDTPPDATLGRLARRRGMTMQDVRAVLADLEAGGD